MGALGSATGTRKKERRKKPDELLSSVVRETAVPAAVDLLRSNTPFVFPSGTAWVMLVLFADAIGGLSKRHGRDEAKGSIIQLIGSDHIQTLATAKMLADDYFGIIPTGETLERMEEFALLRHAEYSWAVVWPKPGDDVDIDLVSGATVARAKAVLAESMTLEAAVGPQAWRRHSGTTITEDTDDAIAEAEAASESAGADDGDAIFDPLPVDEPVFTDEPLTPAGNAEVPAEPTATVDDDPAFLETGGMEEFDEDDDDVPIHPLDGDEVVQLADQDQTREEIARRFLSDELDLEVRLTEFHATFAIAASVVQIDVPQGTTEWLSAQVAQLTRQANADLTQLRHTHQAELQVLCVTLLSAHAQQVIRDVATDRDGSRYKSIKDSAEQAHRERESAKEQQIREAKARIAHDHEHEAKKRAEQAALDAEIRYDERHRPRMQRDQADAAAEIDRIVENAYSHDQQEILRVRRADAALMMQVGTTKIFEVLAERQSEYLAAEAARLAQWRTEIQRMVDDNRKADIAHAETLAEHQRSTDAVAIARREHEAHMETMRNEHTERIRLMEGELERIRADASARMRVHDAEWQHRLGVTQEQVKSYIARTADLMKERDTAESSANSRWAERLKQTEAPLAREVEIQGRWIRVLLVLMIAVALFACLAGFIAGSALGG
ncbi:hypothetical protein [Amycolatopsis sp. PS_44_ISF1]|uniref:hypothetical protein n=1 Tax=Amycolatopsis sp. PS_44_ISF1 TaxID=2974917 RepID=UPI0028DEE674|nr:hypothetical protein [Amycolatopsis sp. PS_44_ISF1]MDT8913575.1 hypothetical protein [Amycolatopsis sp. PS_44_ISF1]